MNPLSSSSVLTLGGLIVLLQLANIVTAIFARFRRNPPIDQTLRDYVRRDEFDKLRDELRRTDAKLFDLARDNSDRVATLQASISTQLGRLESSVDTILKGLAK